MSANNDYIPFTVTKDIYSLIQEILPNENCEQTVFHYTTTEVLDKLLESGTFWATNLFFLNDAKEFIGSIDFFQKIFYKNKDVQEILMEIKKNCSKTWSGIYSVSFSTEGDSLQQWVTYAKESGISIEFDFCEEKIKEDLIVLFSYREPEIYLKLEKIYEECKKKIRDLAKNNQPISAEITKRLGISGALNNLDDNYYDVSSIYQPIYYFDISKTRTNNKFKKKIESEFNKKHQCSKSWEVHKDRAILFFQLLSAYVKEAKFKGEGEVRMAFFASYQDFPLLETEVSSKLKNNETIIKYFRLPSGVLRPYIEVKFCKKSLFKSSKKVQTMLPIKSIIVGPSGKQQKVFEGIVHRIKYGKLNVYDYSTDSTLFEKKFRSYAEESIQRFQEENNDVKIDDKLKEKVIKKLRNQIKSEESFDENFDSDSKLHRIVNDINENNYFSKEGIWIKKSKIPYIF